MGEFNCYLHGKTLNLILQFKIKLRKLVLSCFSARCPVCLLLVAHYIWLSFSFTGKQTSDFLGAVSISLKGGSKEAPSHTIISPSLKGRVVFRGQIETSSDNNLTFYRVPDLLDPTVLANPFGWYFYNY